MIIGFAMLSLLSLIQVKRAMDLEDVVIGLNKKVDILESDIDMMKKFGDKNHLNFDKDCF
jgi:di/tripeptidase